MKKVLYTDFENMEMEFSLIKELAKTYEPVMWLVDSYQITSKYVTELRKESPVFLLDDIGELAFCSDGIINYNIAAIFKPDLAPYRAVNCSLDVVFHKRHSLITVSLYPAKLCGSNS